MEIIMETILCLMGIFGIVFTTAAFFDEFKMIKLNEYKNKGLKVFSKENSSNSKVVTDIYIIAEEENLYEETLNKVINSNEINDISDVINVYRSFDKK